jgi:hypothetical protein
MKWSLKYQILAWQGSLVKTNTQLTLEELLEHSEFTTFLSCVIFRPICVLFLKNFILRKEKKKSW